MSHAADSIPSSATRSGVAFRPLAPLAGKADMRRSVTVAILGAFTTTALAIAINVATGGSPPGVPARFQIWAWPAVAVLMLATAGVALTDRRAEPETEQLRQPA